MHVSRLDQRHAAFDQALVVVGPVVGQLGDRRGTMALEPGGFQLASRHLAGHDDLEGALAQFDLGWRKRLAVGRADSRDPGR